MRTMIWLRDSKLCFRMGLSVAKPGVPKRGSFDVIMTILFFIFSDALAAFVTVVASHVMASVQCNITVGPVIGKVTSTTGRVLVEIDQSGPFECVLTPVNGGQPVGYIAFWNFVLLFHNKSA